MITKFVDREEELRALREALSSGGFELIVVYGRRRIGKTRLVLEAASGMEYVYYLAVERGNLERFRRTASRAVEELRYARTD